MLKVLLESGLNLALLTTIIVNLLVFRERHRNRFKDFAVGHTDYWIRNPFVDSIRDLKTNLREQKYETAQHIRYSLSHMALRNEENYPIISRKFHRESQILNNFLGSLGDCIQALDPEIPSFRDDKNSSELSEQAEELILSVEKAMRIMISEIKEEITTTDLVVLGTWGKYNPLRQAIPKTNL